MKLDKLSNESKEAIQSVHQAADKSKEVSALEGLLGFASGEGLLAAIAFPLAETAGEMN